MSDRTHKLVDNGWSLCFFQCDYCGEPFPDKDPEKINVTCPEHPDRQSSEENTPDNENNEKEENDMKDVMTRKSRMSDIDLEKWLTESEYNTWISGKQKQDMETIARLRKRIEELEKWSENANERIEEAYRCLDDVDALGEKYLHQYEAKMIREAFHALDNIAVLDTFLNGGKEG